MTSDVQLWRLANWPASQALLISVLLVGCTLPPERISAVGGCREDTECPALLNCDQSDPGKPGECACDGDDACPGGLFCRGGSCTDGERCDSGRCCLEDEDCQGSCSCHAGLCMIRSEDGIQRICSGPPLETMDAHPSDALPDAVFLADGQGRPHRLNQCGGLRPLTSEASVGDPCECGGYIDCDGPDRLICRIEIRDREGTAVLGARCDTCGEWNCVEGTASCVGGVHDGVPRVVGEAWQVRTGDRWVCRRLFCGVDGTARVTTLDDIPCGGCRVPIQVPEEPCGCEGRGTWRCAVDEEARPVLDGAGAPEMYCDGPTVGANVCGGCSSLTVEAEGADRALPPEDLVGRRCGMCRSGRYRCIDDSTLACFGDRSPEPVDPCNRVDDDCDGVVDEETDRQSDPLHCGDCDTRCEAFGAAVACEQGRCQISQCIDGFMDRDGVPANGCECEVRLEICNAEDDDCDSIIDECRCDGHCRDVLHLRCPLPGEPMTCEPRCIEGFIDADGEPGNGCECEPRVMRCGNEGEPCDGGRDEHCAALDGGLDEGADLSEVADRQ